MTFILLDSFIFVFAFYKFSSRTSALRSRLFSVLKYYFVWIHYSGHFSRTSKIIIAHSCGLHRICETFHRTHWQKKKTSFDLANFHDWAIWIIKFFVNAIRVLRLFWLYSKNLDNPKSYNFSFSFFFINYHFKYKTYSRHRFGERLNIFKIQFFFYFFLKNS